MIDWKSIISNRYVILIWKPFLIGFAIALAILIVYIIVIFILKVRQ